MLVGAQRIVVHGAQPADVFRELAHLARNPIGLAAQGTELGLQGQELVELVAQGEGRLDLGHDLGTRGPGPLRLVRRRRDLGLGSLVRARQTADLLLCDPQLRRQPLRARRGLLEPRQALLERLHLRQPRLGRLNCLQPRTRAFSATHQRLEEGQVGRRERRRGMVRGAIAVRRTLFEVRERNHEESLGMRCGGVVRGGEMRMQDCSFPTWSRPRTAPRDARAHARQTL